MWASLSMETVFLQEAWIDRTGDSFTQDEEGLLLYVSYMFGCLAHLGSSSSVEPFLCTVL